MIDPLSDEVLLTGEMFPIFPAPNSTQLEKLSIESHTHKLRLKDERIKRQNLGSKLKLLKRELFEKDKTMQDIHAKWISCVIMSRFIIFYTKESCPT